VSEPKPSAWAQARFGDVASELARTVSRAIYQAHDLAMAAHVSGGLQSNDTYGATLHVAQYEQLAAEAEGIPGVSIRKPKDVRGRFDLVVLENPPVVLYPWRYATDKAIPREQARLRPPVSDLRKTLLTLNENTTSGQLTLDQAQLDPEQLEDELAEEQAVLEQLARLGQVVTVGFASNPGGGIFDLGWGDVELIDEDTGRVVWRYWEQLPPPGDQAAGVEPRQPVSPAAGDGRGRSVRFDDAAPEDDLGLKPRPPVTEPPISEPERPQKETGSDEP
jgi:hypothetical protein